MYDFSLRYVVLGEKNSGKSWFVKRFSRNAVRSYGETDIHKVVIEAGKHICQIEIADTPGDVLQRTAVVQHLSHRTYVILVFNLSCRKSFEKLIYWHQFAREHSTSSFMRFIIVGIGHGLDRVVYRNEVNNWMNTFLGIKKGCYYEIYEYTPPLTIRNIFILSAEEICSDVLMDFYEPLFLLGITRYDRFHRDQHIYLVVSPVVGRRKTVCPEYDTCFSLCVIL